MKMTNATMAALLMAAPQQIFRWLSPVISTAPANGEARAAERLRKHKLIWKDTPSSERYSRQRARADMRSVRKQLRSERKQHALQHMAKDKRFRGGAAEVR